MTTTRLGIGFIGTGNISSAYLRAITGHETMAGFPVLDVRGLADMRAEASEARAAEFGMVRLPLAVAPIFLDWLERHHPGRRSRVEGRIRAMREGKLNSSAFGERMAGRGILAEQIRALFRITAAKLGLDGGMPPLDCSRFRRPAATPGQLWLF